MSWPLASHFSAVLQNPRIAFREPTLQQCRVEKDARSQPRPWAGAFAVVYKAYDAGNGQPFAIRVFTTESPERRERYELISSYLQGRRLNCLVGFEYRDRAIRSMSDGKWYPVILMEWVQGRTLLQAVQAWCNQGDTQSLDRAARQWVELAGELAASSLAHGDLQHANVMVSDQGQLKLVDYDCMCVPTLVGRRNLEVGVEPYQHPGRNATTPLSLDLDHYSALVIYVALRALSVDPGLWQRYVEQPGYDKLLFRPEDFQSPSDSPLYGDLMHSPNEEVRRLTQQLFAFAQLPMSQVMPLGQLVDSFGQIEQLLERAEWAAAVELLNRRGQFRDAPDHLRPLIQRAYQEVCREEAWEAFVRVPGETNEENDRALVRAWNESLFAGFEPAEGQRLRVGNAQRRVRVLDRLYHQVGQVSEKIAAEAEQKIVEVADALPGGYRYSLAPRVEQARRRVRAIKRLEQVLAKPTVEAALVAAGRTLAELQCDHLIDPKARARIKLAEQRAPLMRALHDLPADLPPQQRQQKILKLWDPQLLRGCQEADRFRPLYEEAALRRDVLKRLSKAVEKRDKPVVAELVDQPCLQGLTLPKDWAGVIEEARAWASDCEGLLAAVQNGQSDALAKAFDARLIRLNPEAFEPHREALAEWVKTEVLPLKKLALRRPMGRRSITAGDESPLDFRLRWVWPEIRVADRCLLVLCSEEPSADTDPSACDARYRRTIDRARWEEHGECCPVKISPEHKGMVAAVWAMVDLGWTKLYGGPLVLGPLEERSRRSFGLFGSRREQSKAAEEEPTTKPTAEKTT